MYRKNLMLSYLRFGRLFDAGNEKLKEFNFSTERIELDTSIGHRIGKNKLLKISVKLLNRIKEKKF